MGKKVPMLRGYATETAPARSPGSVCMRLDLEVKGDCMRQCMRAMTFGWLLVLADVICRVNTWRRRRGW